MTQNSGGSFEGMPPADPEIMSFCYRAINNGVGYSVGDVLRHSIALLIDPTTGLWSAPISTQSYYNVTTHSIIALGNLVPVMYSGALPPNADLVPCETYDTLPALVVLGDGAQIAGPARAALAPFNGAPDTFNTSAIGGKLQSITVTAFATIAGLPGLTANQVMVIPPGGTKLTLAPGESRTWSVARDQDDELKRDFEFVAFGMAYATITWTVV